MTIWLPIEEFPLYEVNQYGQIRHYKTGYIKKPSIDKSGYEQVKLTGSDKKVHSKTVHRLVAKTFYDVEQNTQLQVNHIDGNKRNNFIGNLEFVTNQENVQHAYDTGIRKPSGGRGPIRKIKIIETGEIFENIKECANRIHSNSGNVCRCVNDPYKKKTVKGFHLEAVEEGD